MSEGMSYKAVILLQIVIASVAVSAGSATGWYLGQKALRSELFRTYGMSTDDMNARLKQAEKDYADLYAHCEPLEGSEKDQLIEAQTKVDTLKKEISTREAEIARLEVKAKENVVLKKELERKKTELNDLKGKLDVAEKEKAELEQRLEVAIQETTTARAERDVAKVETVDVKWEEFKAAAQLSICEKGSRKKLGNCRGAVVDALGGERERRYRECVQRKAAIPQLREIRKDEKAPPAFAEWLGQGSKYTKGWYILYCDPTLPEAGDGVSRSNPAAFAPPPEDPEPDIEDLDAPEKGKDKNKK